MSVLSLRLTSGIVLSITLLFTILALVTRSWIVGTNDISIGLFQAQSRGIVVDVIKRDAEKVAIAFVVLAMISLLAASILVIIAAKVEEKDKLGKIGGTSAVVAALFLLVAMATYTGLTKDLVDAAPTIKWGYSYALGWVAFCLAVIAGPLAIFAK